MDPLSDVLENQIQLVVERGRKLVGAHDPDKT